MDAGTVRQFIVIAVLVIATILRSAAARADGDGGSNWGKIVLAAHLANQKVKFWIDGCTKANWWGKTRPQIYDIYIGG